MKDRFIGVEVDTSIYITLDTTSYYIIRHNSAFDLPVIGKFVNYVVRLPTGGNERA